MSAKEYLQQIKKIDTMLKNKSYELKRVRELELSAGRVLDDMAELDNERAQIIKAIEQLPEAEYDILYKVYAQGETLYEVAADRGESYSNVTTIHGKALRKIGEMIHTA